MEGKRLVNSRYITGFNGIRTIAVVSVILYHLFPNRVKGGYLGVPVFFVLSGYLITDLLRQEYKEKGLVNIRLFYVRRIKRLYPALILMLISSSFYITLFQRDLLNNLRGVVASSLLYWNNWWQIFNDSSYFDRFGNESPFTHLWSLAVEGQFYFIWPLIFVLLVKLVRSKGKIFGILFGASLSSFLLMWLFYKPGIDPTRVYYGTDTRLFSILLGCGLAFIWPSWRMKKVISKNSQILLNRIGLGSFLFLLLSFFLLNNGWSFSYRGGFFLVSIISMVLIAVVAHPGASWNKWLTNPVFDYIGKRSYGIYLYQYPIIIFYEDKVKNVGTHPWLSSFIEVLLVLLVSEFSYRFFEKPLMMFNYKMTLIKIKEMFAGLYAWQNKVKALFASAILLIFFIGLVSAPSNLLTKEQAKVQKQMEKNKRKLAEHRKKIASEKIVVSKKIVTNGTDIVDAKKFNYLMTEEDQRKTSFIPLTVFGDSVMLGSAAAFQEVFPKATIDGVIGRQAYTSAEELRIKQQAGQLTEMVWLSLGTNGEVTSDQVDEIMDILGKNTYVFWSTVHVPTRAWQNGNNKLLTTKAEHYKNLYLIDWHGMANSHDNWFYEDQVHPNSTGQPYYVNYVAKTIVDHIPDKIMEKIQKIIDKNKI
ncbi:MAG: acetyltransferase [Lactobacillales bacterium]|jgi:peptidoglycan/LPS O-acetylase OafA/YrhL|nr:acetyltransferase [Lactobacillales bacterium]